jgi:phosphoglycolate phosphatase
VNLTLAFDLDGTLLDSATPTYTALAAAFHSVHVQPPSYRDFVENMFGYHLERVLIQRHLSGAVVDSLLTAYRAEMSDRLSEIRAYPEIGPTLAQLSQMFRDAHLGVVTNRLQTFAETLLDMTSIREWFSGVVGAEVRDIRKTPFEPRAPLAGSTKTERLARFLSLIHTSHGAGPTLMIGDRGEDGLAAAANDVPFIRAGWGYGVDAEFATVQVAASPRSPSDLRDIVAILADLQL